ncbi:MAG: response regulator [Bacteroidales bacterium]|nr:response regulator [Bacteroidales bacterium]
MTRTLLIDDEPHIRDTLRKLLARHCPQVNVVGEASGVAEGIIAIQRLHPDLVFLDINLEDGSGFDLLHSPDSIDFKIIFISAFDKDTIQAFKLSSLEFLEKPINPDELRTAIKHAEKAEPRDLVLKLQALVANFRK